MENMRFKVGDRVRIKSLDWYNENKDNYGAIYAGNGFCFWKNMTRHCGEIMKITTVKVDPEDSNKGFYFMENSDEKWTDDMIECKVEEENTDCEKCGLTHNSTRCLFMDNCPHNKQKTIIEIPEDWVLKDENGDEILTSKIILEKKKKAYPKTYGECCKILGILNVDLCFNADYRSFDASKEQWKRLGLMNQFYQLLICRDAYWKIAGDELGLGKPWKLSIGTSIYYIYYNRTIGTIKNDYADDIQGNVILAFPTEEMRDAFYENFKSEIEQCKELL